MCGRFTQTSSNSEIAKAFNLDSVPAIEPKYNIAPTQQVATILRSDPHSDRQFQMLRWGLIPSWAKEKSIGAKLINARAETVAEKPSFRSAFRHSRCLIIADGFYEWQKQKDGKQPFYIRQINNLPFAFAGLFSTWQPPDGEILSTCTIITTEANEIMQPIHDRMPVILKSTDYDLWLDPTVQKPELLKPLLRAIDSNNLKAYPVSTKVNSPRHDSPECLESIEN
ncbi:MAG: SOS response-associated peptidase [Xenococcaceae cyanobacterium]